MSDAPILNISRVLNSLLSQFYLKITLEMLNIILKVLSVKNDCIRCIRWSMSILSVAYGMSWLSMSEDAIQCSSISIM